MSIASRITSMEDHIKESYQELKGLGIDINVNKNLKNIPILLDNYWETLPKVSGSGTNITLDNTKEGKMKIRLKGDTSQNGTPTPDSPIPIEVVTGGQNISIQNKNLCLGVKEITNTHIQLNCDLNIQQTITISVIPDDATSNSSIFLYLDGTNAGRVGTITGSANTRQSATITLTNEMYAQIQNASSMFFEIYRSGNHFTSASEPQIENNNEATLYTAHQSQEYEINLGKNLFDKANSKIGNINTSTGQETTGTDYAISKEYIPVKPGAYYSLQYAYSGISSFQIVIYQYDKDKTFIRFDYSNTTLYTKQLQSNTMYIKFRLKGATPISTLSSFTDIQLEESKTPTTYAPYKTPIELCKIGTYQDYIYKSGSDWKIHKEIGKVTLAGGESENWNLMSTDTNTYRFAIDNLLTDDEKVTSFATSNFMNNNFQEYAGNTEIGNIDSEGIAFRNNLKGFGLRMLKTRVSDLTTFKTWLGNHNTIVYYVLATAIEETITDTELIGQLNNLAYGSSYNGQTNVNSIGNIASLLNANAIQG